MKRVKIMPLAQMGIFNQRAYVMVFFSFTNLIMLGIFNYIIREGILEPFSRKGGQYIYLSLGKSFGILIQTFSQNI